MNLLSRKQAAYRLGIKAQTLAVWACQKKYNIRFVKMGGLVKYRKEDIEQFIIEQTRENNRER